MVLVGPSGCGKTTALRMLAGLEEISDGEIRIGDRVVNDLTPKDRDIAMVFQSYALYPHMTVEQNLAFGLKLRKMPKNEVQERVYRAARVLQIEEFLKRKPRALSGGPRQRVAMGRAIVREPQAFLMDEPLSNLDAKLRVQMRAEIHQLQRRLGVTTLYVTHDQVEAMTMGDRVAVMNAGHLLQVDTPQVLYDKPVNEFVAGFIGSPSINLVEAELAQQNGNLTVKFGDHVLTVDDQVARNRSALGQYVGRTIMLGIRPEDFEDAALAGDAGPDRTLPAVVDIHEDMGSELFLHFSVDAAPIATADIEEAVEEAAAVEAVRARAERRGSPFVARIDRESRAREGEALQLRVDTRRLHFFDPETGDAIRDRPKS
jgi:multiple sugar transport system ATP-binding protein